MFVTTQTGTNPLAVEEPLIIERQDTCESYLSDMPREEELEEDAGPDTDCTQVNKNRRA